MLRYYIKIPTTGNNTKSWYIIHDSDVDNMRQPRRYVRFINPLRLYYKHNEVKSEKSVIQRICSYYWSQMQKYRFFLKDCLVHTILLNSWSIFSQLWKAFFILKVFHLNVRCIYIYYNIKINLEISQFVNY